MRLSLIHDRRVRAVGAAAVGLAVSLCLAPAISARTARAVSHGRKPVDPRATASAAPSTAAAAEWDSNAIATIDPQVFQLALGAAQCAVRAGRVADPPTLTVIDYSKPSTSRRLWVFDLHSHDLLYQELVAHGQGSGDNLATMFSNDAETHRSSIGLFVTGDTYVGKNGYSLRLDGLDAGYNDHARDRAIVMHGAPYVSADFARAHGRLGRSWGCPALSDAVAKSVIDRVKNGSLVFSYYPDQHWLQSSPYLGSCQTAN
jgi:hypothetical protein